MSQSPNTSDPDQPQSAPQPPAYGAGQPSYPHGQSYSQQPYGQQAAYGAPGYGAPYGQAGYAQPKSKVAAALLAFFFGGLGIHNFYRGQTRRGVIHLCLAAVIVGLFIIGGVVLGANTDVYGHVSDDAATAAALLMLLACLVALGNRIWAFVEFIMILVSNDGSLR